MSQRQSITALLLSGVIQATVALTCLAGCAASGAMAARSRASAAEGHCGPIVPAATPGNTAPTSYTVVSTTVRCSHVRTVLLAWSRYQGTIRPGVKASRISRRIGRWQCTGTRPAIRVRIPTYTHVECLRGHDLIEGRAVPLRIHGIPPKGSTGPRGW